LDITILENGQLGLNLSDTVLGMFSTLMIDAFFLKKKVVSVQPVFAYKNLCILSKKQYIPIASSSKQLIEILTSKKVDNYEKIKKSLSGSLDRLEKFLDNEKN